MKKLIKPLFPLCAILLASCGADDEIVTPDNKVPVNNSIKKMSFSASIKEDVTRAEFDEQNKTVWSENDKIWVYNAAVSTTSNIQHFTLTKGYGTKNAEFEGEQIDHNEGEDTNDFYAFYPYDANNPVTFKENTVATTIPSVQAAKENLFETGYQYMTAYTKNSDLSFRNIVSFFKVTVKSSSTFQVSRIKIVANNVTQEDGNASASYTKKFLNIAGDFSAEIGDDGKASNITVTDNASNVVETTITPSTEAKTYYLAVLPTTDNLKFTLLLESEFAGDNGQKIYQATNSGLAFEAGKIYDLGTYEASNLESKNKVLDNVVDLDLPSGTIWATTNVGASAPTDMGDYYRWGRLMPYNTGNAANGGITGFNQYSSNSEPTELATDHDVAYQKYPSESSSLKGKYVMPNKDQAKELTIGGYVSVPELDVASSNNKPADYYKVVSSSGKYILMPVGGRQTGNTAWDNQAKASYWSKVRRTNYTYAYWFDFRPEADFSDNSTNGSTTIIGMTAYNGEGNAYQNADSYNNGRLIRPVVLNKNVAPASAYPGN